MQSDDVATRAAERAARVSYGRLLAYLSRAFRDVAAAEDALAEAFASALAVWPLKGVPANAEAWLLVAARNRLLDMAKARKVRLDALESLIVVTPTEASEGPVIPDKRLELMFVCAHPAIDGAIHAPLMLQTVLGMDAARIASCFLVAPAAMGQRLSRAKARIRDAGIRFDIPDLGDVASRATSVREAIFAAYATGWDALGGRDTARLGLSSEAIWLARVLVELIPDDAEAKGLLATMLFCEARRAARIVDERYVPLREQDLKRWNYKLLREAEATLSAAAGLASPGRFQIEAAIQSATVQGLVTGRNVSGPLLALHRALVGFAPTLGNRVALAASIGDAEGPEAGLAALDTLNADRREAFQPWWAVRAYLLVRARSDIDAIETAYRRAIGLCDDAPARAYLSERLTDVLSGQGSPIVQDAKA